MRIMRWQSFEVLIFLIREGCLLGGNPLVGKLLDLVLTHFCLLGLEGQSLNKVEVGVTGEGSEDPEERLLVLVVGLGRDVEVLQVALPVESDLAGLNLPVLLVDLVSHQDDGDVVANSGEILVPLGDVLVGNPSGNIEHDDRGVGANVVTFPQSSEFFLTGGVPESQFDGAVIGVEGDGADFDSLSGDVLLLELSGDVPLYEGGFADSSVSDQYDLELCYNFRRFHVIYDNPKVDVHL